MSIVRTDACTDAEAGANSPDRLTYAKMAAAQAALLVDHQYSAEAEQAYRLAMQISPASPETVYGLGQLLATTGRSLLRTRMSARRWLCRDAPRGEGGRTRVSLRKLAPTGPSLLEKRA